MFVTFLFAEGFAYSGLFILANIASSKCFKFRFCQKNTLYDLLYDTSIEIVHLGDFKLEILKIRLLFYYNPIIVIVLRLELEF